jgi:acetyl esterase/lipase
MLRRLLFTALVFGAACLQTSAQEKTPDVKKEVKKEEKKQTAPALAPTKANVPYGTHERQVLDFYQAKSDKPTPLVFYIHGGGWQGGDKKSFAAKPFLDAGISVVAINYRYVKQAVELKVEPPVKAPLEDAAIAVRALKSC